VGGKVFTMLDTSYVYTDIYLPTTEAGRVRIGSEARIVLDAYPAHVIPAKVVFIASQAQFTPKTVETKDERDKLMFRIRVRIDPERLRDRAEIVRSGLPGVAYVRTDPSMAWPPRLRASAPP
jgi:HlyD family secretion protein